MVSNKAMWVNGTKLAKNVSEPYLHPHMYTIYKDMEDVYTFDSGMKCDLYTFLVKLNLKLFRYFSELKKNI